jgi:serine protease Do
MNNNYDFNNNNINSYYTENIKKPKNKTPGILVKMIAVSLISSMLGAAAVTFYYEFAEPRTNIIKEENSRSSQQPDNSNTSGQQTGNNGFSEVSIAASTTTVPDIAEKVGPSVVGIKVTAIHGGKFGLQQSGGEGSGIIYSQDGYIITNYHVIQNAVDISSKKVASGAKIEVILPSRVDEPYDAQVVGYDSKTDLAVIKIEALKLPAVELGDSDKVKVGEVAIAIGNPGGLEYMGSVTMCIVSGLNRSIETENGNQMKLIQTDVAINPGNSGGALVNSQGRVIGINSIKIIANGYEGLGFAIPSNTVKEIADSLINYKYVKGRTLLGIKIDRRYNEQVAQQNNLSAGVYVQDVTFFGSAYKAGIKAGDIITKFAGQTVKSYDDLDKIKGSYKPGDAVQVEIFRNGETRTVQITLDEDQGN